MTKGILSKKFKKYSWRNFAATLGLAAALSVAPETGTAAVASSGLTISNSETYHTRQMDALAARINRESPDVKVVVVSRDWFWMNMAQNNGNITNARKEMLPLAERYVHDKIGIRLSQRYYMDIVNLVLLEANNSLVVNLPDDKKDGPKKACFVLPPTPDADSEYFLRKYTLNLFPDIHGSFAKSALQPDIRPEIHNKFNVYHELGHCFQDNSAPAASAKAENTPEAIVSSPEIIMWRHKKEVEAEIFGALLLAHDGITNFAEERANARLSGESTAGPVSYRSRSRFPYMGELASLHQHFGYIYTLHGPLRAAQEYINHHRDKIAGMSVSQLVAPSSRLAEKTALDENAIMGALFLWETLYDQNNLEVLYDMRREASRDGQVSSQRAADFAFQLIKDMNKALKKIFVLPKEMDENPIDHIPFDFTKMGTAQATTYSMDDVLAIRDLLKKRAMMAAGGLTKQSLIHAYEAYKDGLRMDLENDPASEKPGLQNKLNAAYEALRLDLHELAWEKEAAEMQRQAEEHAAKQRKTPEPVLP
ncbi:MAG: hypothetical protein HY370_10105 [Proteobacteria bacterium]|nr:hypothetical protein [Pseudomonadota bacterium]